MIYETHWRRLLRPSWEREMDSQYLGHHILRYWAGLPDLYLQTSSLRCVRIGAANREEAQSSGYRPAYLAYECAPRNMLVKRFQHLCYPWAPTAGTRPKMSHACSAISPASLPLSTPTSLASSTTLWTCQDRLRSFALHTTARDFDRGSWCLQIHRSSSFMRPAMKLGRIPRSPDVRRQHNFALQRRS